MTTHYFREIDRLKRHILALGALVEEQLHKAVKSVEQRDVEMARLVIAGDEALDAKEVEIEEECLKILALYQPVAIDLRYIIAVLKINSDLERIGDLAVNIAQRTDLLAGRALPPVNMDFPRMTVRVQQMLKQSIDAMVNLDVSLAQQVCAGDDEVDRMNREMYGIVTQAMAKDPTPDNITALIHLLSVSRFLERISDHATNIAEDVIYFIEGRIVRHQAEK